jgi:hypothetical protein
MRRQARGWANVAGNGEACSRGAQILRQVARFELQEAVSLCPYFGAMWPIGRRPRFYARISWRPSAILVKLPHDGKLHDAGVSAMVEPNFMEITAALRAIALGEREQEEARSVLRAIVRRSPRRSGKDRRNEAETCHGRASDVGSPRNARDTPWPRRLTMPFSPRFGLFWTPSRGVQPFASMTWRPRTSTLPARSLPARAGVLAGPAIQIAAQGIA